MVENEEWQVLSVKTMDNINPFIPKKLTNIILDILSIHIYINEGMSQKDKKLQGAQHCHYHYQSKFMFDSSIILFIIIGVF